MGFSPPHSLLELPCSSKLIKSLKCGFLAWCLATLPPSLHNAQFRSAWFWLINARYELKHKLISPKKYFNSFMSGKKDEMFTFSFMLCLDHCSRWKLPPGQLPPWTIALPSPTPRLLPPRQLPPRTMAPWIIVAPDNCPQWKLPPRIIAPLG